jgi:hypothetical protein
MFLEKVSRRVLKLNLDDKDDVETYNEILNDPLASILSKKWEKLREEDWMGEDGSVKDTTWLIIEIEEKSL